MTASVAHARRRAPNRVLVAVCVVATGCALLAARPALVAATPYPLALLLLLFVGLLVVGARFPVPPIPRPVATTGQTVPPTSQTIAIVVGVTAFVLVRVLVAGHPPAPATLGIVVASSFASIAEEAWFRRLCYGVLEPGGPVFAVVGSSVLFAAVHVAIYGPWVLPLDLAAGLVLGWQRRATGSWSASAVTHVVANLLVAL